MAWNPSEIWNLADADGSGSISHAELSALAQQVRNQRLFFHFAMPNMIVLPRQARDKHRKRTQTRAVLSQMKSKGHDPTALMSIVSRLDADGSGDVEFEEWCEKRTSSTPI
jgi:hypothetical protein